MRKLSLILLILLFFILGNFTAAAFFIHRTIIIKPSQLPSIDWDALSPVDLTDSNKNQRGPVYLESLSDLRHEFLADNKTFLEVNLSEMKMRLHKEGKLQKESSILAVGDPQGWGGSAVGLYKIMSGARVSYSVVSEVYMPYALRYYGKYYLHGEPYYPGGAKLISSISGGCVRLQDSDAKDFYEMVELNMPVLVIDKEKDDYQYNAAQEISALQNVSAKSYLAADLDSGFVFIEKNSQEQLSIASLTKLITALVVAENIDLRKFIMVRPEMLEAYGSTKGLETGKSFRVVELFYPLLIESSNDAAEVLSGFLGRTRTIEMMQEKAKAIFMENTELVDPHGFDLKNVSTAQDLFYLARYILNNRPPLLEITRGREVRNFGAVGFSIKDLWNKNVFIDDPSFVGGKTGFLPQAKHSALFIFRFLTQDQTTRDIAIILLGSDGTRTDTQKIYKWLQENYSLSPVFKD